MLDYCDKCGWTWQRDIMHEKDGICGNCEICGNVLKPVPDNYFENPKFKLVLSKEMKQKLIEDLVKTSPNFDQYYFDNAINIKGQKDEAFNAKIAHGKAILEEASRVPKCPTCQSTNIRKIGGVERGASIWAFGLFSKKINKSFKCNSCGYTW